MDMSLTTNFLGKTKQDNRPLWTEIAKHEHDIRLSQNNEKKFSLIQANMQDY